MADYYLDYGPGNYRPQASAVGIAELKVIDETNGDNLVAAFDKDTVERIYFGPGHRVIANTSSNVSVWVKYKCPTLAVGKVNWEVGWRAIAEDEAHDAAFAAVDGGGDTVPGVAGRIGEVLITITTPAWQLGDFLEFYLERDADDGTDDTLDEDCYFLGLHVNYAT